MPVKQIDPENERERKRFVALEQELLGSEQLHRTTGPSGESSSARGLFTRTI